MVIEAVIMEMGEISQISDGDRHQNSENEQLWKQATMSSSTCSTNQTAVTFISKREPVVWVVKNQLISLLADAPFLYTDSILV